MKIYISARFSRIDQGNAVKKELESNGHVVTSRWLKGNHKVETEDMEEKFDLMKTFADDDLEDIKAADAILCITEEPRKTNTRGGRHVEAGYAMALGKRLFVLGPVENAFYTHFIQVTSVEEFLVLIPVFTNKKTS